MLKNIDCTHMYECKTVYSIVYVINGSTAYGNIKCWDWLKWNNPRRNGGDFEATTFHLDIKDYWPCVTLWHRMAWSKRSSWELTLLEDVNEMITSGTVERVSVFKLFGVTINSALKWDSHVTTIVSKAVKRLWFLKKLKRAGVSVKDLVYYYQTVVRPLLEYACPAWHSGLTKEQTKTIDDVQCRVFTFMLSSEMFHMMKPVAHSTSLCCQNKRDEQCKTLFKQITNQWHILHRLLPAKRGAQLIGRLRSAKLYPTCHARTARFLKSFIPYSLAIFQWLYFVSNYYVS